MMLNGKTQADFIIAGKPDRLDKGPASGWRLKILYKGPTGFLDELLVHVGILAGRLSPHPPHRHDHEELHFALSENIEFVFGNDGSAAGHSLALAASSVCFTDSNEPHTFRNTGDDPARYLHIRWKRNKQAVPGKAGLRFFDQGPAGIPAHPAAAVDGSKGRIIYSGPSRFFSKITLLGLTLLAGEGVPLHRHDHEIVFALVAGAVDILGRRVDAPGFAFMRSRVPHCLHNPGPAPAVLYAVEFHGPS